MKARLAVRHARTESDLRRCFPALAELRPHVRETEFVGRIRRQQAAGYHLVFLAPPRQPAVTVAGYRVLECLMWGRFLYVDDLVTQSRQHSRGWGQQMFQWLIREARRLKCTELHLDSGVHRFAAHRFYLGQRLDITCHHFAMKLA